MDVPVFCVPRILLLRILLQLFVIPPHLTEERIGQKQVNFYGVLMDVLQECGHLPDINKFLYTCLHRTFLQAEEPIVNWGWHAARVKDESDWNDIDWKKQNDQEPAALHFEIMTSSARSLIDLELASPAFKVENDPRFSIQDSQGKQIPLDSVLVGTLQYLQKNVSPEERQGTEHLVELRLEQFSRDRYELQRFPATHFVLIGALMKQTTTIMGTSDKWCVYMRDFIEDNAGTNWRVLEETSLESDNQKISTVQAWADIRGASIITDNGRTVEPSVFGQTYRPVYLFYCNQKVLLSNASGPPLKQDGVITMADYSFEEEQYPEPLESDKEQDLCKTCFIAEHAPGNDIYFCDGCDGCVHQLCEDPPIEDFENKIDPWYCRACLKERNLPLPRPPPDHIPQKRKFEGP
ncbi:hypothetical protein J3Q64DRAFT_1829759 [Phycomyces blakesleeanus]|uniref:PHD-type domain-containing protein n=2 Tax=Phycomyces blakesleeanus TaxID=4837 RepID=A0A162UYG7_PHYB8|nr:hypothetical protein PHYBLDRAFT_140860 [Phycomyces blakesleeanus NRRL 1555(-)]OAD78803.1 hypothetical protein PHYBLDRAFT_140860 [Phycomyces blakesleeanus NRRL 1555(-)]|eukprot:XP_018296843.1 hypothetical protein PHYBLDRAFT_140860 [Phycomyces blakesleeanus NRRL 1555(-)]